jgi:hypothetical protein
MTDHNSPRRSASTAIVATACGDEVAKISKFAVTSGTTAKATRDALPVTSNLPTDTTVALVSADVSPTRIRAASELAVALDAKDEEAICIRIPEEETEDEEDTDEEPTTTLIASEDTDVDANGCDSPSRRAAVSQTELSREYGRVSSVPQLSNCSSVGPTMSAIIKLP